MNTLITWYFTIPLFFLPVMLAFIALPEFRHRYMTLADGPVSMPEDAPAQAQQALHLFAGDEIPESAAFNAEQPAAVYTGYKHCCVIDAQGGYSDFVQVHIYTAPDGSTEDRVQHYTLKPGERIVDAMTPTWKLHAGAAGFIQPLWDEASACWVEGATAVEIAAWEVDHPAPANLAAPTAEEQLRADVDFLAAIQGVEL